SSPLPPSATDYFTDDDTSLHEGAIQTIAAAGITIGCNPPTNTKYCPDRPVTRAEMATFLARALDLEVVVPPLPPPPPPPPTGSAVTFAAAGDLGAETSTAAVLGHIGRSEAEFLLALGDLSYNQITPESSWCSWVRSNLGASLPVQMAVGNHEHDHGSDGSWDKFAQCLPDAMSSTGNYPAQYFFDLQGTVRMIVVSAGLTIDGHPYTYESGSADAEWLTAAIRSARTSGIEWVVVGTHKPCISVGKKSCEPDRHLTDLAVSEGVDLMLHGHDHNYQRTHQLSCISVDSFSPACVSDADGNHRAGDGTVLVVSAAVRDTSLYAVSGSDSEAGYFADSMGANSVDSGAGYVEVTATPDSLIVEFIGVTTNHSDAFEIRK
ncbi:MAG: metallophosphoesterase, partial [Acidimicrobiia bacterium]|nr:metallophosphoesterase [Acidimicrobiia bacterium]